MAGVGTELGKLMVLPDRDDGCGPGYAYVLDRAGIAWCEKSIPTILKVIDKRAQRYGLSPYDHDATTKLLGKAIENAKAGGVDQPQQKSSRQRAKAAPKKAAKIVRTKRSKEEELTRLLNKLQQPRELVGTRIKYNLLSGKYGISVSSTDNCKCDQRAEEMDQMGCDGCEENRETCIRWLMEGAAEQLWLKPLLKVFPGEARERAESILDDAIREERLKLVSPNKV